MFPFGAPLPPGGHLCHPRHVRACSVAWSSGGLQPGIHLFLFTFKLQLFIQLALIKECLIHFVPIFYGYRDLISIAL